MSGVGERREGAMCWLYFGGFPAEIDVCLYHVYLSIAINLMGKPAI
jgi:hypothetical protein